MGVGGRVGGWQAGAADARFICSTRGLRVGRRRGFGAGRAAAIVALTNAGERHSMLGWRVEVDHTGRRLGLGRWYAASALTENVVGADVPDPDA